MVISKGSYRHGEFKNLFPWLVQISYLAVRGSKLSRVMRVNIGSRKEICETSGLPIPMVPHLHQSNGYMKSKLRAWRVQKCIALVGADTVQPVWGRKLPLFMGGSIGPRNEICETSGIPITMVLHLHQAMVI